MSDNKFKVSSGKSKEGHTRSGIFAWLEARLKLETYFEEGFPVNYLPQALFLMLLSLLYIGNTHYAEIAIRKINRVQAEVEDLRADYTTLKADLMYAGKQSEVARRVKDMGLRESSRPPYKILIEE